MDKHDTLVELAIWHYGTDAEKADQKVRWNGLGYAEMSNEMETMARAAIEEAT